MMRIAVMAANKTEDIELTVPVDLWRRAGFIVKIISVEKKKNVVLSNGIKVSCDATIYEENITKYNAIFLPGGPGYLHFKNEYCPKMTTSLQRAYLNGVKLLAICAAPEIYGELGFLKDTKATCFPGHETSFAQTYVKQNVVVDKNFITATGPGTASEFAFRVITEMMSQAKADEIAAATLFIK